MQNLNVQELLGRYNQVPRKQRLSVAAAIALVLVVLYYFMVSQNQQAQLSAVQAQLQQVESQRAEKVAYAANLPLYQTRLKELSDKLDAARAMLPDAANVPQFLSQIGFIAKEVNLVIERFEPQPEVPREFYAETQFFVQVRGSYHEIAAFLDKVSRMDRIVNVSELSMDKPEVQQSRIVVTASFKLRAFRSMSDAEMTALQSAKEDKK